jgi:hypothetical protein
VGVECLIAQLNYILMHYGCKSNNGLKLKLSLECMMVELGLPGQPFQESYEQHESWVTLSWLKSLWEKCAKFKIHVVFNGISIEALREGNPWLMELIRQAGFSKVELERINWARLHQQVLFLSCVLGASGKTLNKQYLDRRMPGENLSTLQFPKENSPNKHFVLWGQALWQLVPAGGIMDRLGHFRHEGYKVWTWQHGEQ